MDRLEAARLLRREMSAYARRSREDLMGLIGQVEAYSIDGPTGVSYQLEVDAHWDGGPGGTLRVLGSIDDGGFRASLSPTTDGFLMDKDGVVDMAEPEARD